MSVNKDSNGKPLPVTISNGVFTNINLTINNNKVNFLNIIKSKAELLKAKHKDGFIPFYQGYNFYLLKDKDNYVLAVKKYKYSSISKIRYNLSGVMISPVSDSADNNVIRDASYNKQIVIKNSNILYTNKKIILKAIDKSMFKHNSLEKRIWVLLI